MMAISELQLVGHLILETAKSAGAAPADLAVQEDRVCAFARDRSLASLDRTQDVLDTAPASALHDFAGLQRLANSRIVGRLTRDHPTGFRQRVLVVDVDRSVADQLKAER